MNEIKCPHCGKAFTINETDYESIVKQIKNHEFEKELDIRIKQFNSEKENDWNEKYQYWYFKFRR